MLINRAWDLCESLPEHLRFDVEVMKPHQGARSTQDRVRAPGRADLLADRDALDPEGRPRGDGDARDPRRVRPPRSTPRSAGRRSSPSIADGGQIIIVSTANGIGGTFYDLWMNADDRGVHAIFLGLEHAPRPRRELVREGRASALPEHDRAEQYPLTAADAFLGTAGCWFDVEALTWYAREGRGSRATGSSSSSPRTGAKATIDETQRRLDPGLRRAGRGAASTRSPPTSRPGAGIDYSSPYVIDLTNMNICARAPRQDRPRLVRRAAALPRPLVQHRPARGRDGRRLRRAGHHLAPRRAQGAAPLPEALPARIEDRPDFKQHITYGFPITSKTRPLIINQAGAVDPRADAAAHADWRRSWSARPSSAATRCPHRARPTAATTTA